MELTRQAPVELRSTRARRASHDRWLKAMLDHQRTSMQLPLDVGASGAATAASLRAEQATVAELSSRPICTYARRIGV